MSQLPESHMKRPNNILLSHSSRDARSGPAPVIRISGSVSSVAIGMSATQGNSRLGGKTFLNSSRTRDLGMDALNVPWVGG